MSEQLLLKKECKIGMEVYLVKPDSFYILNEKNPVKGGEHECIGVIINIDDGIKVRWANGSVNYYANGELMLAETVEYHSIWPN